MSFEQKPTDHDMYFMAYNEDRVQVIRKTPVGLETVSGQPNFISANTEAELLALVDGIDIKDYNPLPQQGDWVDLGYYSDNGTLVICIQAHTRTEHPVADIPALFNIHREEYAEWVQPAGAHDAYNIGDKVTFETLRYISLIDANVWSPAVYPAGWEVV